MQKRSKRIKWSLVDLTRPASELSAELGVSLAAIYNARKRLGIEAPNLAGGKIGNKGGGPRYGNQNRAGTGHNMANLNIRLPEELLANVKKTADKRKMNVSEFARQAFLLFITQGSHDGTKEEATLD